MMRNGKRFVYAALILSALFCMPAGVYADSTASASSEADPQKLKFTETVFSGATELKDYHREYDLSAPNAGSYSYANNGIFTFRGDNLRQNASYGTVQVTSGTMEVLWSAKLGSIAASDGSLYGVGINSQPAIIKWDSTVRSMMNMYPDKREETSLREVIFSAQDGKVHFLDLLTGEETRPVINIGFPMKGSVTVDTQSRPVIAFGQSVSKLKNKTGSIGYYVYELIDGTPLLFINGRKTDNQLQYSTNGAFDGTALFLYESDTMVLAGENGLLYTVRMNTDFDYKDKCSVAAAPEIVYLRSKAKAQKDARTSMECSVSMFDRYIYTADAYGIVRCVDSDTMKAVWAVDCGDNTDAALALDEENDGVALYTGNTAYERLGKKKDVTIRRLNALTGETDWTYGIKCAYDKTELSGCKASPVVGKNAIGDLVIFTVNMTGNGKKATILALEKKTGKLRWQSELETTAVSSPVAVYNEQGNAWIIQADDSGVLHLLDGMTGMQISTLNLDGKIQASPAVYRDILVIGTCSRNNAFMYGIKIK